MWPGGLLLAAWTVSGPGCTGDEPGLSREALMDPQSCAGCHPDHYAEWSGSMHAYASQDPVFQALNAVGQRETDGELGDFCISCHAPLAVREGSTVDGTDMDDVPAEQHGITCFFCHTIEGLDDDHNAQVRLADDTVMRGGIADPVDNAAHASAYSPLHDRNRTESAAMCGACHDIVTPSGLFLERTHDEWSQSLYAQEEDGRFQTCGRCHMEGRDDVAVAGMAAPERRVHAHGLPGVDVALTDFPDRAAQAAAVQRSLDTTVRTLLEVCVTDSDTAIELTLENVAAGHMWPSGATHNRRAWVEVVASREGETLWSSGAYADDEPIGAFGEGDLARYGDRLLDDQGQDTHFSWEALSLVADLLPPPTAASPVEPGWTDTHRLERYVIPALDPDRITVRVLVRPIGVDVLQDLVASGDLDAAVAQEMPTWDLAGASKVWERSVDGACTF